MTIEEKARAYDEALALAKRLISNNCTEVEKLCLKCVFPELKESEDERIRKSLVEFLTEIKDISESGRPTWAVRKEDAEMCKSFLNYLEKQKEQSITANDLDEEIHRFFDDCIEVHDAKIYGVDERVITVDCYEITARHFAKWGEKQKEHHLELKAGKWYICHRAFCARADHLTVKEGERFQCEKDGIVKGFVIKEPEKYFKECSAPEPMEKEQKQEWSDEDADMLNCCISSIEEAKENRYAYKETDGDTSYDREIDWLKSLRPQQKVEWSKEDEQRIAEIEFAVMQMNTKRVDTKDKCLAWLNSLRPQPHTVSIKNAIKFGNLEYERGVKDGIQSEKSRQWKPSEEQIDALRASNSYWRGASNETPCINLLESLHDDLEKLIAKR